MGADGRGGAEVGPSSGVCFSSDKDGEAGYNPREGARAALNMALELALALEVVLKLALALEFVLTLELTLPLKLY